MMSFKIISQRFELSKIVICMYFYGPVKKNIFHNTSCLPHSHLVWWRFNKNISKKKNFDLFFEILAHIFASNSKSILSQRALFSHTGTHIMTLHPCNSKSNLPRYKWYLSICWVTYVLGILYLQCDLFSSFIK